ncbi:hypothetical protein ACIPSA_38075 [Streptomyces sp. NPDC086549]|uniref:hypothetical protein n=1 Tax=Streptomyces sp. NPDC086549 TaxID=3365752 RepID=UPI00381FF86D
MSESTIPVTELASQYIAQVTGDLERNVKEQERIAADITALQEQLAVLRNDHTVLANMQEALGVPAAPDAPAAQAAPTAPTAPTAPAETEALPDSAVVPSPRQKTSAESAPSKPKRTRKSSAATARTSTRKPAAKKPADKAEAKKPADKPEATKSTQPTLVELVRRHLSGQSEPRSAAEVTTALGESHPDRSIKTTVVRTTLEGLVAKNHAQRTKQGTSVYYTAVDASDRTPAPEPETSSESADH